MVERGVGGLEIGRNWRAGMGGGVDRDGHGDESGVWTDYCFLLFKLGRRRGGMFCMSGGCPFLIELCWDIDFTRQMWRPGRSGELPRTVAYSFGRTYLLPAFMNA